MITRHLKLFIFLVILSTSTTHASGDYDLGKQKSQTCIACHGVDGNSENKLYPRLAGQYQNYLIHSLNAYKNGDRKNPIMNGFAGTLSDQDILDISKYFSEQQGLKVLPKN